MNISIIDDHKILADLLKLSLIEFDFINSIDIYDDPKKFQARLDIFPPDILITDMLLTDTTGIEVIDFCRAIKSKSDLKIIVLSSVKDPNIIKRAFDSGSNGYLGKDAPLTELIEAINIVAKNENAVYVGESLKKILVEYQLFEIHVPKLSPREQELLKYICEGLTPKEISGILDLSMNTVQSYMKQLFRKMNVNRTTDLILKAIKLGYFSPN